MYKHLLFILVSSLLFSSCTSYQKLLYLKDLDKSATVKEEIKNYTPVSIQTDDLLTISVTSLNQTASAIFNTASVSSTGVAGSETGILVDHNGDISVPVIGHVHAAGLTTEQLSSDIRKRLLPYLKEPQVNIKINNFKISLIGEVLRPGVYSVSGERVSITEALSMAGDVAPAAKREQAILIREQNGTREYIPVDLTSKTLFNQPYFYLRNNDMLYVQPRRSKSGGLNTTFQVVSLLLSVVSVGAILVTR